MNFLLVETAGDEKSELLIRIPQQKSVVILHLLQPTAPFKSRLCVSRSILYFGQTVRKCKRVTNLFFDLIFQRKVRAGVDSFEKSKWTTSIFKSQVSRPPMTSPPPSFYFLCFASLLPLLRRVQKRRSPTTMI